jgi:heterodisulfide reductase subunit A
LAVNKNKEVLVIGGGVAGMASALSLADNGLRVHLIEREPFLGGWVANFCCKATDTCSRCSVCLMPEMLHQVAVHSQVSILTDSEVSSIKGEPGSFKVTVNQTPRLLDPEKCTACGICAEICPCEPSAIYLPFPDAIPQAYAIDRANCLYFKDEDCRICQDACPLQAIELTQESRKHELTVGAVIVATGFEIFDAREKGLLGYGNYPNVLTGLDLERMVAQEGLIKMPRNGRSPESICFVQCVGSRDEYIGNGYCSQVCCKYAIRFARMIKHQNPETKVAIFYMDLQTAGKGFGEFYEECKESIEFLQGMPIEVFENSSGQLELRYENFAKGKLERRTFDMVILSVGISPRKDAWNLAGKLGINTGEFGFYDTKDRVESAQTNVEGIFLAGTCAGPKDITDSIAHAHQAASCVIRALKRY